MTPRALAVRALMHQEQNGYANLVLDAELKKCDPPLDPRDAAFAARIFFTAVERQRLLDLCLAQFLRKPVAKLDAPVRAILRAGLAQAKFLDVPVSAAVNESVKLTRAFGKSSAAGMVNAVLRRAVEFAPEPSAFAGPVQRLAVLYSLSDPVAELLHQSYGDRAFAIAQAFYDSAGRNVTAIRVNTLRIGDAELAWLPTAAGGRPGGRRGGSCSSRWGERPAPGSPSWISGWTSWRASAGRWGRPSPRAARRRRPCPPC